MNIPFDAEEGLIVVRAALTGPAGVRLIRLVLDTGASDTAINAGILIDLGYDIAAAAEHVPVATASGMETAAVVPIQKIIALGQQRTDLAVLTYPFPAELDIDGLLGLDFLREYVLRIDFRAGDIELN